MRVYKLMEIVHQRVRVHTTTHGDCAQTVQSLGKRCSSVMKVADWEVGCVELEFMNSSLFLEAKRDMARCAS